MTSACATSACAAIASLLLVSPKALAQPATTPAPVVEAPAAPDAVGESGAPDEFEDEFGFVDETALAEREVLLRAIDPATGPADDPNGPRQSTRPRLTLEQVVMFAVQNPMVQSAQEKVLQMENRARQAKFAWLPTIEASAFLSPGANIQCDDVKLQLADGGQQDFQYCRPRSSESLDLNSAKDYFGDIRNAGVSLRVQGDFVMPVFTFGKAWAAMKMLKIAPKLAKLDKVRQQQDAALKAQEAYLTLLLARESLTILNEAWALVEKHSERMREKSGDTAPNDILELENVEVEIARKIREARRIEGFALAALWALAGDAAPPFFDIAAEQLEPTKPNAGILPLANYRESALRERPEAKLASAFVELRAAQEKLARSMFYPDLGISGRVAVSYANRSDSPRTLYYRDRPNNFTAQIGLGLRWRLDLHNRYFELQDAKSQVRAAQFTRQAAKQLLFLELDHAYVDVLAAKDDMELTEVGVARARRQVIANEAQSTVGGGSFKDLSRSLTRWAELEFEQLKATATYNAAMARLTRAVGKPL